MTGLTQSKALYPFIKSISTDYLYKGFGNISNDNKRQRTIMCPYKGTMDVVSYCRLVYLNNQNLRQKVLLSEIMLNFAYRVGAVGNAHQL